MGDLALNEYSWKNSKYTEHVQNNIFPTALQKFYDILKSSGHFKSSPTFANNDYVKEVIDPTVRIPVCNSKISPRGFRPTIALSKVPRRYLDFWTTGEESPYPAVGTTMEIMENVPRLVPYLDSPENAISHGSAGYTRPGYYWEITLQLNNVYPFGWYARYIGDESALLAQYGGLKYLSGYAMYTGIKGQTQSLLYKRINNPDGSRPISGTKTDTLIPVKFQKVGGVYDIIYIPYMSSFLSYNLVGSWKLSDMIKYGRSSVCAHLSLINGIKIIYYSSQDGEFNANPWASTTTGEVGVLTSLPYSTKSKGSNGILVLAPQSVWEQIFTGSGMSWSYDESEITSPDDSGFNSPDVSGIPDNPTDENPGTGDNTTVNVEYPSPSYIPNATVYDRYFLTPNQVPDIKKFLFSDTFIDNIKRLWTNPAEYVISLVCYPFDVASTGLTTTNGVVSIGGVSSNIAAAALTDRGVPYFYGGSVYVDKYYNSYLDFEPYTSIDIYIPYIGVRPLNVSQVVGHTLCIGYYIDLNTQQITALIGLDGQGGNLGQVVTQFVGSIGTQTPLSGTSAQDMIRNIVAQTSGLITGVGAIAGGVMGANPALLASGVASTSNALLGGGHTAPSYYGSLSPVSGLYTPQVAYLIINRPRQALPSAYLTQQGFSSNYSGKVSLFSGYLECVCVNLPADTTMTAEEQQEIINLLTGGIYCG